MRTILKETGLPPRSNPEFFARVWIRTQASAAAPPGWQGASQLSKLGFNGGRGRAELSAATDLRQCDGSRTARGGRSSGCNWESTTSATRCVDHRSDPCRSAHFATRNFTSAFGPHTDEADDAAPRGLAALDVTFIVVAFKRSADGGAGRSKLLPEVGRVRI